MNSALKYVVFFFFFENIFIIFSSDYDAYDSVM